MTDPFYAMAEETLFNWLGVGLLAAFVVIVGLCWWVLFKLDARDEP